MGSGGHRLQHPGVPPGNEAGPRYVRQGDRLSARAARAAVPIRPVAPGTARDASLGGFAGQEGRLQSIRRAASLDLRGFLRHSNIRRGRKSFGDTFPGHGEACPFRERLSLSFRREGKSSGETALLRGDIERRSIWVLIAAPNRLESGEPSAPEDRPPNACAPDARFAAKLPVQRVGPAERPKCATVGH